MDAFTFRTRDARAEHHDETQDRGYDRITPAQAPKVVASKPVYADAWYHDDAIKASVAEIGHPYRWTPANTAHR